MDRPPILRFAGLHFLALCSFAMAQPLYSILAEHPHLFVARHSKPVDIVGLTLLILFLLPILGWLLVGCARLLGRQAAMATHYLLLTFFFGCASLYILKLGLPLKGYSLIVLALACGVALSVLYQRYETFRSFLTLASLAAIIFLGFFLLRPPISKLVFANSFQLPTTEGQSPNTPIVMLVFDELPLVSLLDEEHRIDAARYPGFAALADSSNWYRHATAVAGFTENSMAAILTGKYPPKTHLVNFTDHPQSLFTLLGSAYDYTNTNELHTSLCPESLCTFYKFKQVPGIDRVLTLAMDVGIVYGHILLPENLTGGLPPINQTWSGFAGVEHEKALKKWFSWLPRPEKRPEVTPDAARSSHALPRDYWLKNLRGGQPGWYAKFLDGLGAPGTDKPALHFVHIMLPHYPWTYLPSGAEYTTDDRKFIEGLRRDDSWEPEPGSSDVGYQRHLLQVGFADTLIQEMVDRLKDTGLYDEALVLVVADHGISFKPGMSRRYLKDENLDEILPVPLFVKLPQQQQGQTIDRQVELVDVVPTVADVLGLAKSWEFDGRSLLDTETPDRSVKVAFTQKERERREFDSQSLARFDSVARKIDLFGTGEDPYSLFRIGPHGDLVGLTIDQVTIANPPRYEIEGEINQQQQLTFVDPSGAFVPAHLTGVLNSPTDLPKPIQLAVALNGVIAGTCRTQSLETKDQAAFSVIIAPNGFVEGRNQVELFGIVSQPGSEPLLSRIQLNTGSKYSLQTAKSSESPTITSSSGSVWTVKQTQDVTGRIDRIDYRPDSTHLQVSGWIDPQRTEHMPDGVLLFHGETFLARSRTRIHRSDTVDSRGFRVFGIPHLTFEFSLERLTGKDTGALRVFSLDDNGTATELSYPNDAEQITLDLRAGLRLEEERQKLIELPAEEDLILVSPEAGLELIASEEGKRIEIVTDVLRGRVDSGDVVESENQIIFKGWAINLREQELADTVMVFVNGKLWHATPTWIDRAGVNSFYNNDRLLQSGFAFVLPRRILEQFGAPEIRFFAVSNEGIATELYYPEEYRWHSTE